MPYNLEKVTSPSKPIYAQTLAFYRHCELVRNFTDATMRQKTKAINYFIDFTKVERMEDITNEMIDDWIAYQKSRNNKGVTINGRLAQLRVMIKWQRDSDIVMPGVKISKIIKQKEEPVTKVFYVREQIDKALSFADLREELMIRLFFDCGLRIGEMIKLRLSDINGRKMKIIGKGRKQRFVIMSEETFDCLQKWIKTENITDYLWSSSDYRRPYITDDTARKWLRKPFYAAGLYDFHPHALRHSYATELKKMGVDNRKIQAGLGHSNELTTERYLHDLAGFDIEELYENRYRMVEKEHEAMNLKQACNNDPETALLVELIKQCKKNGTDIKFGPIIEMLNLRVDSAR